ncbi:beta-ketoacyl synthase N-terminal-like domain-containing protein [Streptomyces huasconensis]|uniref:beta-ketoacyl synthase N-terminal-like domain-containing protein n=1 Tax=Streptomyces huasconensis TaxID=1854574 RepID=UPI0033DFBDBD
MVPVLTEETPVITAWSAISPWGLDSADFTTGLRSGKSAALRLDPDLWETPFDEACVLPDFDIRAVLGRKGTRSMDRVSALAVTAAGRLLDDGTGTRPAGIGEGTGLVLGTSTGSAQSMMSFTRDSFVGDRPYLVDPARFPNTVMNCAAGQSAIWHRLKGPNTTLAGGRGTGLLALRYGLRLQRAGRAETLLCGAVEEFSPARAWLEWHARGRRADQDSAGAGPLGEGAALWLLERAGTAERNGRRPLAVPLGLEFGFARDGGHIKDVLADCLRRLLTRVEVAPREVGTVADSGAGGAQGEAEHAALVEVFGAAVPDGPRSAASIGDTSAASAAFQLTAVLALAEPGTEGLALITTVEANGVVGAALLSTRG